jgi:hypothetical protein
MCKSRNKADVIFIWLRWQLRIQAIYLQVGYLALPPVEGPENGRIYRVKYNWTKFIP